jgi:hypothetical protein
MPPTRRARAADRVKRPSPAADVIHIDMTQPEFVPERVRGSAPSTPEPA